MKIDAVRIAGNDLILTLANPREAAGIAYKFKPGEYALTKAKKKRSLDANAYCWLLIGKIADKVRMTPMEIYRNALAEFGETICETIGIEDRAAGAMIDLWCRDHIGRRAVYEPSDIPSYGWMKLYIGSSDFDVGQMSALIELLVQDCIALEIETKPEWEVKALLDEWEKREHGS